MSPRIRAGTLPLFVLLLSSMIVSGASALEKTVVRVGDWERPGEWGAATTCEIAYYNYCTGWIWVWGGWAGTDVVGVCYGTCCSVRTESSLQTTWELIYTRSPPGWSFTGTIDIWRPDENRCPASLVASQPFYFYSGWNGHSWGIPVPSEFVVTVTFGPQSFTRSRLASDRPAAGPTGPPACGICYQLNRLTHSYYYGTSAALLCPGETWNDGACDVEWIWDVAMSCEISVETSSWARMKALYR
jgi:hypothetical protein